MLIGRSIADGNTFLFLRLYLFVRCRRARDLIELHYCCDRVPGLVILSRMYLSITYWILLDLG